MPTADKTQRKTNGKPSPLAALLRFDAALLTDLPGACALIGLDEVGRGSLIGPVVGGAVCIPPDLTRSQRNLLRWLNDSKKLTAAVRADLSVALHEFCQVGIGQAAKEEVDRLNVHYASLLALHRAFLQLCQKTGLCPESGNLFLVMDGRAVIPDYPRHRQKAIIKGDGQSAAIAAASVVAKQARDSLIIAMASEYPGYGWEENMGYGTPAHLAGLKQLGITPHHRVNYRSVQEQLLLTLS